MTPRAYFKFLARDAIAPITRVAWSAGAWVEAEGPLAACESGVHVLRAQDLAHWVHEELWRVEGDGEELEGVDCVVVRRARLVDRVAAWEGEGGERFAAACLDRVTAALGAAEGEDRTMLEHHRRAVAAHVQRKNRAMAAYVSAMGLAKAHGEGTIEARFRDERAWQSAWLVRELALGA
jgi:hypothetical protein